MIAVEKSQIGDIPLLHVVRQDKYSEQLPFIIFLHGFTSSKEKNLHYAYHMADSGFRVVLPEAFMHGNRANFVSKVDLNLSFWDIVLNTIEEINAVKTVFEDRGLIDERRIGLAGTSMGAITTLGALTKYDWIKAAVSLMGIPSFEEFAKWQLDQFEKYSISVKIDEEEKNQIFSRLRPYDLNMQPEKLQNRPLLFWHGINDPEVPFTPTYQFYEKVKELNIQEPGHLEFIVDEKAGHKVSGLGVKKTVEWFERFLLND